MYKNLARNENHTQNRKICIAKHNKDLIFKGKSKWKETNQGGDNKASLVWNALAMPQDPVSVACKRRGFHGQYSQSQFFLYTPCSRRLSLYTLCKPCALFPSLFSLL